MIGNPVKTLGNNMLSGFQGKIFKCSFSDRQFGQYICSGKTWVAFHLNYFYLHQWLEIHTMFIKMGSPTLYTLKKKNTSLFQWPNHSSFIYHTCDIQMMLFLNTKLGMYAFVVVVGSGLFNDGHENPCYQGNSLRTHHNP